MTFQEMQQMKAQGQLQPQPKQRNLIESLIGGAIDPFVRLGKQGGDFLDAASSGKLNDFLTGNNNYKTRYQSAEEYDKFNDDPLLAAGKTALGVGSFFVPGGPILGGAISGGLSAASQDDADLTSILSGAALGGATGGVLKIGGKALKGLSKAGKVAEDIGTGLKGKNLNPKFSKNVPINQTKNNINSAVQQLEAAGLPINPQNLQKLADDSTAAFRGTLSEVGSTALPTAEDLTNQILSRADNPIGANTLNASPLAKARLQDEVQRVVDSGGDLNKLFDQKGSLTSSKILGGDNPDANLINQILNNTGDTVRDTINKAVPQGSEYFMNNSAIRQLLPDAATGLNKGDNVPLTGLLGGLELPGVGAAKRGATNALGGGIQKTGKLLGKAGDLASKIPSKFATPARNATIASMLGFEQPQAQDMETQGQIPEMAASDTMGSDPNMDAQYQQIYDEYVKQLILPVKAGGAGLSIEEAYQAAPLYAEQYSGIPRRDVTGFGTPQTAKATTEKQKAYGAAASAAQEALGLLDSGAASTGKISNVGNKISEFFGQQSEGQTSYNSAVANARGYILNALSGAAVSPSEFERLRPFIPSENDEPKVARQKLKDFIKSTTNYNNQ